MSPVPRIVGECLSLSGWQLEREEREAIELRFRKNMEVRQFLEEQMKVRHETEEHP
jgi:hypothetical protein